MEFITSPVLLTLSPLECLFLATLGLFLPTASALSHRKFTRQRPTDIAAWRRQTYRENIIMLWALCFGGAVIWMLQARPAIDAGFIPSGALWPTLVGLALVAVVSYFLLRPQPGLTADKHKATMDQFENDPFLLAFTPASESDLRGWSMLSVTAGITEEVLYRGMLLGLLTPILGLWGAAVASVVIFALGHAYQGPRGMARVAAVGAVLTAVLVLSGSIWPAVILHIAVDLSSGRSILMLKQLRHQARQDQGGDEVGTGDGALVSTS